MLALLNQAVAVVTIDEPVAVRRMRNRFGDTWRTVREARWMIDLRSISISLWKTYCEGEYIDSHHIRHCLGHRNTVPAYSSAGRFDKPLSAGSHSCRCNTRRNILQEGKPAGQNPTGIQNPSDREPSGPGLEIRHKSRLPRVLHREIILFIRRDLRY